MPAEQRAEDTSYCEDYGRISFQGLFILLIVVGIVWGAITLLPLIQTPADIETDIKSAADEWLRISPRFQNPQLREETARHIRQVIEKRLENHTWDPKELKIDVQSRTVTVSLPYTLNINLFGFEINSDKQLFISQEAISF